MAGTMVKRRAGVKTMRGFLPPSCLKEGRRPASKDGGGPLGIETAAEFTLGPRGARTRGRLLTMRPGESADAAAGVRRLTAR